MRAEKILLILNPVSGKTKSKAGIYEILDELYRDGYGTPDPARRVTVCPTMYRGHATHLASIAHREGYDTVVCCGGDGTLNETVNGILTLPEEERPVLGYIPAGSTNDFAASIGLPGSLREAAAIAGGDREELLDVGQFCTSDGTEETQERYFSYIASFGAFTETSYSTPQATKNVLGHVAYLLESIKDIANIQPRHVAVELSDGRTVEGDYLFGAMTNTTSAAGVVKLPADKVSMSDGEMEVFLIGTPKSPAELNKLAAALLSGNFEKNPLIGFYHTPSARFTMSEPLRWSLDGEEAQGGLEVEITCRAGAIRLKST